MRFAYADPPYLGLCRVYQHSHGDDGRCWDEPETHRLLIERLSDEYDGWALSMGSIQLRAILPMCPEGVRVAAWVKPFASFKKGVSPAYAWEPLLFVPLSRKHDITTPTTRDWVAVSIALERGFVGAKPEGFCRWMFDLCRLDPADEFVDLFHGSGAVGRAWSAWSSQLRLLGA